MSTSDDFGACRTTQRADNQFVQVLPLHGLDFDTGVDILCNEGAVEDHDFRSSAIPGSVVVDGGLARASVDDYMRRVLSAQTCPLRNKLCPTRRRATARSPTV